MILGEKIARLRRKNGWSQEELADKMEVSRQAVSKWESGKTQPDLETLQKIAQVLEVSVEELIYGERRQTTVINQKTVKQVTKGLSFGAALAMVISYVTWRSIGWAIFHGLLNWVYVVYFVLKYGWS